MKGTLRKVNDGIVFTIDERPSNEDWYFTEDYTLTIFQRNKRKRLRKWEEDVDESKWHKIIASTFGVGLELVINFKNQKLEKYLFSFLVDNVFNTEYPYTIQDNKVIITL